MRYFPPSGTAGFERSFVSGNKRVPAPPPMTMASVRCVVPGGSAGVVITEAESREAGFCVCTPSITQAWRMGANLLRASNEERELHRELPDDRIQFCVHRWQLMAGPYQLQNFKCSGAPG